MRAAVDIIRSNYEKTVAATPSKKWLKFDDDEDSIKMCVDAINEAREEAIRECAEVAQTEYGRPENGLVEVIVDQKSILSLLKENK